MRTVTSSNRFLGYVQLRIGERLFALPVQAVEFDRDAGAAPGGFFDKEGEFGILVDSKASKDDVEAAIALASADAVRYFSKKFLN